MSEMKNKKVCIVGLGYIGLPTAALLACNGFDVAGVDVDPTVVDTINQGRIHIVEPDLQAFVTAAVESGRLQAALQVRPSDIYMICVPTPFKPDGDTPTPDLSYIEAAADVIAPELKAGDLVILESTSPAGATEMVSNRLAAKRGTADDIHVAYCPERVLPGKIMTELVENDRVIGGMTDQATELVAQFYAAFVRGEILKTNARTAELCKLTENSFRDVNIAFANELSLVCDEMDVNVWELIRLANRHPRVDILRPGTGVGGHCIAVDPWFIVSGAPETARLIRSARDINDGKPDWVVAKLLEAVADVRADGRKPVVACLGLAFKPDIDDLRESPAVEVAEKLQAAGCEVIAVEPNLEHSDAFALVSADEAWPRPMRSRCWSVTNSFWTRPRSTSCALPALMISAAFISTTWRHRCCGRLWLLMLRA